MSDGFLGRWARRKQEVREGRTSEAPPAPVVAPAAEPAQRVPAATPPAAAQPVAPPPPPPTLQDVQTLTPQSDFQRFVAPDVAPEVKNAAMKKLFSDPHFNVMDGLDIYIDDYSKPDPLPLSMLRQMASAQFLKLVEEDEEKAPSRALRDNATSPATPVADAVTPQSLDQPAGPADASQARMSAPLQVPGPQPTTEHHADTDLRLQQDHAPGAQGPGHRVE